MTDRQIALNSIEIINQILANKKNVNRLKIYFSGVQPSWKTIMYYDESLKYQSNLSEGFRTWKEVRVFLSGIRCGLMQLGE